MKRFLERQLERVMAGAFNLGLLNWGAVGAVVLMASPATFLGLVMVAAVAWVFGWFLERIA